jgi:hypothetical protein
MRKKLFLITPQIPRPAKSQDEIIEQVKREIEVTKDQFALNDATIVIAPHLYLQMIYNYDDEDERELAMEIAEDWMTSCDQALVCCPSGEETEDMKQLIVAAIRAGIDLEWL